MLKEISHNILHHNWLLLWMFGLIITYLIIRSFHRRYWKRYRMALILPLESSKLLKEKNIDFVRLAVILNFVSGLSIACFFFLSIQHFTDWAWPEMEFGDLILFSLLTVGVILFRYVSVEILGQFFKRKDVSLQINHVWLLHIKAAGFLLLLCSFMIEYSPNELNTIATIGGLVVIFILIIISVLRSIQILRQNRVSLYYGILYLCTLEILPVVVIVSLLLF
ncbi:MAG: DUF4271 domain-containing protein [Bacteroidetes bacterium]|jgi:hypothetical protein|nr:DUF4271 domain-containing protein [Bacteroidota bacterium]MBT3749408.1 DUF4271 domain-containing protein [Bacteroidota bacterium]MBT4398398.1 DUF4271 domain-containing protein [Bacteroidota bacterium]MBT4411820.1 DUF4271 domain-containing protein [Bacteroidota bacterium]MBT7094341.1 DUF4271 domain-containing protein [Bacteroidota bacterium]